MEDMYEQKDKSYYYRQGDTVLVNRWGLYMRIPACMKQELYDLPFVPASTRNVWLSIKLAALMLGALLAVSLVPFLVSLFSVYVLSVVVRQCWWYMVYALCVFVYYIVEKPGLRMTPVAIASLAVVGAVTGLRALLFVWTATMNYLYSMDILVQ